MRPFGSAKLRLYWLYAGLGWVALVVWLSLANLSIPQGPVEWGDKLNHLVAYGFLMSWLGQLVRHPRHQFGLAVALAAMGWLMEFLQGMLAHRWFDVADAAANMLGVLIAWVFFYLGTGAFLGWLERRFV